MTTQQTSNKVQYNGQCAFAVSLGKLDVAGTKYSSTIDGKQYQFSNPIAKILFKILPNRIAKADANWKGQ